MSLLVMHQPMHRQVVAHALPRDSHTRARTYAPCSEATFLELVKLQAWKSWTSSMSLIFIIFVVSRETLKPPGEEWSRTLTVRLNSYVFCNRKSDTNVHSGQKTARAQTHARGRKDRLVIDVGRQTKPTKTGLRKHHQNTQLNTTHTYASSHVHSFTNEPGSCPPR